MSFSRFLQVGYAFGLSLSLSLLLWPSSSRGQYRATPGIPGLTTIEDLFPFSANFIPNNGRIVSMPGPPFQFLLNNFFSDTTALGGMGMQGCMGFGGISGGIIGVPPLPLPATGFLGGGLTGINGGVGGIGGQGGFGGGAGGLGMGGAGGMGGFAGKGMGGFNGKKAL